MPRVVPRCRTTAGGGRVHPTAFLTSLALALALLCAIGRVWCRTAPPQSAPHAARHAALPRDTGVHHAPAHPEAPHSGPSPAVPHPAPGPLSAASTGDWVALARLFDTLGGESWKSAFGWVVTHPVSVCSGNGNMTHWQRVHCSNGRVAALRLTGVGLSGQLPADWSGLDALTMLDLTQNPELSGVLPTEWLGLSALRVLRIYTSAVSGTFPAAVRGLETVRQLQVSNSRLSGSLPTTYSGYDNLEKLSLSYNLLSSSVPRKFVGLESLTMLDASKNYIGGPFVNDWSNLPRLATLLLHDNQISGPFPDRIVAPLLVDVDLGGCDLEGVLPRHLQGVPSLAHLHLQRNRLSSTIADAYVGYKNVKTLALDSNMMSGPLPDFVSGWQSMTSLTLSSNGFSGMLRSNWSDMPHLNILDLSSNQFEGTLPHLWHNATSLQSLYLGNQYLEGTIPSDYDGLPSLLLLSIESNLFSMSLPSRWTGMGLLDHLDVSDNRLTSMESRFEGLDSLGFLSVSKNPLNMRFPTTWVGVETLGTLQMSKAGIYGEMGSNFSGLPILDSLDLSDNEITRMSPDITGLVRLRDLHLGRNLLNHELDCRYSGYRTLSSLTLRQNHIRGSWCTKFEGLAYLTTLDIADNLISSTLTTTAFDDMHSLTQLDVSSNFLSGTLPSSISNAHSLRRLILDHNRISGTIPFGWGAALRGYPGTVTLNDNSFTSFAPEYYNESIWMPRNVRYFNGKTSVTLARNKFSDVEIPPFFCALSDSVEFLDLSFQDVKSGFQSGGFVGTLPGCLLVNTSLKVLDVSHNALRALPSTIYSAKSQIDVLRAGLNNISFSGLPLPSSDTGLNAAPPRLSTLSLSGNRLGCTFRAFSGFIRRFTSLKVIECNNCDVYGVARPQDFLSSLQLISLADNRFLRVTTDFQDQSTSLGSLLPLLRALDVSHTLSDVYLLSNSLPELVSLSITATPMSECLPDQLLVSSSLMSVSMRGVEEADERCQQRLRARMYPQFQREVTFVIGDAVLTCPQWNTISAYYFNTNSVLSVDPSFLNYRFCRCPSGFIWSAKTQECINEVNRLCSGEEGRLRCDPYTAVVSHCIVGGFYPLVKTTSGVHGLPETAAMVVEATLIRCRRPDQCNRSPVCPDESNAESHDNDVSNEAQPFEYHCAAGYEDLLCSKCARHYWRHGSACVQCHESVSWLIPVTMVLALVGVLAWQLRQSHKTSAGEFRVLSTVLFWFQLTNVLEASAQANASVTANATTSWAWLANVRAVFESWCTLSPLSLRCLDERVDYVTFSLLLMAAPVVATALFGAAYAVPQSFRQRARLSYVYLWLVLVMWFPVSVRVLSTFNCEELVPGLSVLSAAPYIECAGPRYNLLVALSVVMLVVFVVGIPACVLVVMRRSYNGGDAELNATTLSSTDSTTMAVPLLQSEMSVVDGGGALGAGDRVGGADADDEGVEADYDEELQQRDRHDDAGAVESVSPRASFPPPSWSTRARSFSPRTGPITAALRTLLVSQLQPRLRSPAWVPVAQEFFRKLVLAAAVGLVHEDSVLLPLLLFFVLFLSFLVHVYMRPWRYSLDNVHEAVVLLGALTLYLLAIVAGARAGDQGQTVLVATMSVIHLCVLCLSAHFAYRTLRSKHEHNPDRDRDRDQSKQSIP